MDNEITVVIVTFNSDYAVLNRCINSIEDNIQIIIVDNSSNLESQNIENYKIKKIKIIKNENTGNGDGINIGVDNCNSKYVLYLDVDTQLPEKFFDKMFEYVRKIKDFAILSPSLKNYTYLKRDFKNKNDQNSDFIEMNFVQGAIMLINIANTYKNNIRFDKKIFLYWEEFDFYQQCFDKGQKIYLIKNILAIHEGSKSINKKMHNDIEYNRHWHYMWSKFYFYKKHFGIINAYKKTLKHFVSATFKCLIFYLIRNEKYKIYKERFGGLINSYLGKPSLRRPIINKKNN